MSYEYIFMFRILFHFQHKGLFVLCIIINNRWLYVNTWLLNLTRTVISVPELEYIIVQRWAEALWCGIFLALLKTHLKSWTIICSLVWLSFWHIFVILAMGCGFISIIQWLLKIYENIPCRNSIYNATILEWSAYLLLNIQNWPMNKRYCIEIAKKKPNLQKCQCLISVSGCESISHHCNLCHLYVYGTTI